MTCSVLAGPDGCRCARMAHLKQLPCIQHACVDLGMVMCRTSGYVGCASRLIVQDGVLNSCLSILKNRHDACGHAKPRTHIFSTFFFTKLLDGLLHPFGSAEHGPALLENHSARNSAGRSHRRRHAQQRVPGPGNGEPLCALLGSAGLAICMLFRLSC
jgi:hypothetical protein